MTGSEGLINLKCFGPYELLEKVGVGGMGSVYKARTIGKDDVVALKIANRVVAGDPVLSHRFYNESKIANQLRNPNLVQVLGHGVEDKVPYLVMEYVPGQSLDKQIKNKGPVTLPEALAIFGQVAEALDFIHKLQFIHRDIKPGNILIDPKGKVKLGDMGLIKNLESNSILTRSGTGLGTFEYAAPEQFDDAKHVDLRCDIYALAASLYVALTGKCPFGPGSQMRVLMHKLEHQFTPLSEILPGVSLALDQIVIRSLHPDPAVRPASVLEFLRGMGNKEPPKTILTPKPLPPVEATVRERRGGTRHPVQVATTLGPVNHTKRDSWSAQVMDISAGGLCLQISRRFEINTLLYVYLPDKDQTKPSQHLVRACWIKHLPDNNWLLGCLFANPLTEDDLNRMLYSDLSKTDELRKPKT